MAEQGRGFAPHSLETATSAWPTLMDTRNVDEATAALLPAFYPVDIVPTRPQPLHIQVKAEQLPLLSIGYLAMGGEAVMRVLEVPGYQIAIPMSGHTVTRWPDGRSSTLTAPGWATVFDPGTDFELTWSHDCAQLGLNIAPAEVHRELEKLLGRPARKPVEFARRPDLTSSASQSWLGLVELLVREVGRDEGLLRHRLAAANLQHLLIEGLLLTQPHNYANAFGDDGRTASAAVVSRTIDLMRCYPETAWTTAELAGAAGVSARALQKAFANSAELPPMTYLRHLRLHAVRTELADASGGRRSATITAVARRWGFVRLGRFAEQYRQLFGESLRKLSARRTLTADGWPRRPSGRPRTGRSDRRR